MLRDYPHDYVTPEMYKQLLYWNAWAHYQNGGDNRLPDQNEFWSDGSARTRSRSATARGSTTRSSARRTSPIIEDAMGLRPRSDAKIELDPIDIGWDHFTANNIRYRDRDLTVTWDEPGGTALRRAVPAGYSVFLDGELAFTVDELAHVVYDPATGEVERPRAAPTVTTATAAAVRRPQDVRFADDARVVDVFAKAGADVSTASTGIGEPRRGRPVTATFAADGRGAERCRERHDDQRALLGHGGIAERQATRSRSSSAATQTFDDVRLYFYDSSSTPRRSRATRPSLYTLEYAASGQWSPIPGRPARRLPRANLNHVQFPEVTGDAVRVTVTHAAGAKTGLKELQVFARASRRRRRRTRRRSSTAWQDAAASTAGQAALVGTAKDDGLPAGDLELGVVRRQRTGGRDRALRRPGRGLDGRAVRPRAQYVLRLTATTARSRAPPT